MDVREQIEGYIAGQPRARSEALRRLHERFLAIAPGAQLWFLDGRDASGKVVSNPNIGYGAQTITCADGGRRDFYNVGLSANTPGLSVYVMGLEDRPGSRGPAGPGSARPRSPATASGSGRWRISTWPCWRRWSRTLGE